jgi:anthranilate synthase/aminodeoxychorismate synthase-like glutamine amidotransferase
LLLLIDNYDSFVHNLARYFRRLEQETVVVRNDQIDPAAVRRMRPAVIVLSPGPCAPDQAGASLALVRELHQELPILGVCLGHQTIGQALGGRVVRALEPVHGRSSEVFHAGQGIFAGLPNPLRCARYHSLVVEEASLPADLRVLARTADGVVMALAHRRLPVVGVQFHPESILTDCGYALLAAFLRQAGVSIPSEVPGIGSERDEPPPELAAPPASVSF